MNEREIEAGLAPTPGYRYAEAVGGQLFIAGQVPLDGAGQLIGPGDPAAQASACLRNLATVIEVNGFAMGDVRRLTVHVVGPQHHLSDAWAAVRDWFEGSVPPATLLGAHLLGYPDQLVEIDATIVAGP